MYAPYHKQTGFQIFLRPAKRQNEAKLVFKNNIDNKKTNSVTKEEHTHLEDCCQSEASWAQEQSSQPHDLESESNMLWRINSGPTLEKYSIWVEIGQTLVTVSILQTKKRDRT